MTEDGTLNRDDKPSVDKGLMNTGFGIAVLVCTMVLSFLFGDAFSTFGIGYLIGQWGVALGLALPIFIVIRYLTKWGRKANMVQTANILFLSTAAIFVLYAVIRTTVPNKIMKLQTTEDSSPIAAPLSKVLGANGDPVVDAKWSYMGTVNVSNDKNAIPEFYYCNKNTINRTANGQTISCLAILVSGQSVVLERESLLEVDCAKIRWRESSNGKMFGEWSDIQTLEASMGKVNNPDTERYIVQTAQIKRARVQAVCSSAGK